MTTVQWQAAGATDIGRVRRGNEDAFLVDAARGVFIVADGMGGHAAGEVASALAVDTAGRMLTDAVQSQQHPDTLPDVLGESFQAAWQAIHLCCKDDIRKAGMGTTLTAAVVQPSGTCWIGHIGDSRAYVVRDGRLEQLTRDHTWVQREVDAGRIAAEAAENHPLSHILTRVLSADLPPEPDLLSVELLPGDLLLLSSDGMHGLIPDSETEQIAASETPLESFLDALIERANRRGGRDNITAVAVRILPDT